MIDVPVDFYQLAKECAQMVHPITMQALVKTESQFNPFAIGIVGGALKKQPTTLQAAIAAAKQLEKEGHNFSVGLGQINIKNFSKYGLTYETAFNPCENLKTGGAILADCYKRAQSQFDNEQLALQGALSCYYSGNFKTGFIADFKGQAPYVQKVINNVAENTIVEIESKKEVKKDAMEKEPSTENKPEPPIKNKPVEEKKSWDVFGDF